MMFRLSRGCFVFLLVMLAWSAVRVGMIATGFDHSLLGCGSGEFYFLNCESTLLTYLLNAPLFVFLVFPLIYFHIFKALLTFKAVFNFNVADFIFNIFAHPQQALFGVLAVIYLAVLILGLFVFPWLRYRRWRSWW